MTAEKRPYLHSSPSAEKSKRLRSCTTTADFLADDSNEVEWADIERELVPQASQGSNESHIRWIQGQAYVVYEEKTNVKRFKLQNKDKRLLLITIAGAALVGFKFSIGSSIRLSLKGATAVRASSTAANGRNLPYSLHFSEGAAMSVTTRPSNQEHTRVIDSWDRPSTGPEDELPMQVDDWYSSPPEMKCTPPIPGNDTLQLAPDPPTVNSLDNAVNPPRRKKRRHRRNPGKEGVQDDSPKPPKDRVIEQPSASSAEQNQDLDVKAGLTIQIDTLGDGRPEQVGGVTKYTPLDELNRSNMFFNVIGVVSKAAEPRQVAIGTGDWKLLLELKDPSRFKGYDRFQVQVFARPPKHLFLPKAEEGDVILLRDVKVNTKVRPSDNATYFTGTVFSDKLRWVGYHPSADRIFFPLTLNSDLDEVERTMYRPSEVELAYMVRLGLWWKALKNGTGVIQVSAPIGRPQSLMSDRDVGQFFDAVVEVISMATGPGGQRSLEIVVSDYTECPLLSTSGPYGQWAVRANSTRVSEDVMSSLAVGTFWSFDNVKLKWGRGGNAGIDLDLYNARFRQLEEAEGLPRLQELLKRKALFLKGHRPLTAENAFPKQSEIDDIKTIAEAKEYEHCNLIVELIHKIDMHREVIDLYVTDYTENSKQSDFKPPSLRTKMPGLHLKVLQIGSWQDREFVKSLSDGKYYQIHDVKFRMTDLDGLKGALSYASQRVKMVSEKANATPAFQAFLKRRDEYWARQNTHDDKPEPVAPPVPSDLIISRLPGLPLVSVKKVLADNNPTGSFRISARVKDFYPLNIKDFCSKICTNCNKSISSKYNACMQCEDFDSKHVRWIFRFFLLLEDQEGESVIAEVCREASVFLSGIEPSDLRKSDKEFWTMKRRLIGILGNLVDVHDALEKEAEEVLPLFGPYCNFSIEKAKVEVSHGEVHTMYSLTGCELSTSTF